MSGTWQKPGLTFKQKIREEFNYKDAAYKPSVTDPSVEKYCEDRTARRYKIEDRPVCLCVSLGEPFEGFAGNTIQSILN